MTKEQFEILSKYDEKLMSIYNGATHVSYITYAMRNDCGAVYAELFGRKVSGSEWNCPHCAFKIYKQLAMAYGDAKNSSTEVVAENKEVKKTKRNGKKKQTD